MNILQFFRIFWARRRLILATTGASLIGAIVVAVLVPPRWEAHSRIMLNLVKPDPVSGEVIASGAMRSYVSTQVELVTDYSVVSQVLDQLGWISDPRLIEQYHKSGDVRDYRHWLAQQVIDNTKAHLLLDSNILDISYNGTSPEQARAVADALRKAYVDTTVSFKRDQAARNADWYDGQAKKAKSALDAAEDARAAYERQNGIVLQNDTTDLETARLQALAQTSSAAASASPVSSAAAMQLAQVNAQIAQESRILGPNHPELQQLRSQKASLEGQVAAERAAAARAAAGVVVNQAVQAQKSRVIANSDKIARLKQLQADVDLRRDEYNKTAARAAELRQQALSDDSGVTELGPATTPKNPKFPNVPLIIAGALGLGFAMGGGVALLMELLHRRVRSTEDLQSGIDAPVLAVVALGAVTPPAKPRATKTPVRRKLAQA